MKKPLIDIKVEIKWKYCHSSYWYSINGDEAIFVRHLDPHVNLNATLGSWIVFFSWLNKLLFFVLTDLIRCFEQTTCSIHLMQIGFCNRLSWTFLPGVSLPLPARKSQFSLLFDKNASPYFKEEMFKCKVKKKLPANVEGTEITVQKFRPLMLTYAYQRGVHGKQYYPINETQYLTIEA